MEGAHHVPTWVKLLPVVLAASGVALAVLFYGFLPGMPGRIAAAFRPIHLFFFNKWYFDELYDRIFVSPAVRFGAFCGSVATRIRSTVLGQTACRGWFTGFLAIVPASRPALSFIMPLRC